MAETRGDFSKLSERTLCMQDVKPNRKSHDQVSGCASEKESAAFDGAWTLLKVAARVSERLLDRTYYGAMTVACGILG